MESIKATPKESKGMAKVSLSPMMGRSLLDNGKMINSVAMPLSSLTIQNTASDSSTEVKFKATLSSKRTKKLFFLSLT